MRMIPRIRAIVFVAGLATLALFSASALTPLLAAYRQGCNISFTVKDPVVKWMVGSRFVLIAQLSNRTLSDIKVPDSTEALNETTLHLYDLTGTEVLTRHFQVDGGNFPDPTIEIGQADEEPIDLNDVYNLKVGPGTYLLNFSRSLRYVQNVAAGVNMGRACELQSNVIRLDVEKP